MATLRHHSITPPGGWRYVQPETGVRFASDNFRSLCEDVAKHRAYKALPLDTIAADIERQLCTALDLEWCRPAPGETHRPVRDLTYELTPALALNAMRAVTQFLKDGATPVPREEAERRAALCRGCPFNQPAKFCACSSVYTAVESLIPRDRRPTGLAVCTACGCSLAAKVNLPASAIAASLPAELVLPGWCWQGEARGGGVR